MAANSFALDFNVYGPCSDKPLLSEKVELKADSNAGAVTIDLLNKFDIPYLGTEMGMNSIFNTPVGLDAMEIISDAKMRSHGWCYSINGEGPSVYPNEVYVGNEDSITWYFCYISYDAGVWDSEYFPTYSIKPQQFCQ